MSDAATLTADSADAEPPVRRIHTLRVKFGVSVALFLTGLFLHFFFDVPGLIWQGLLLCGLALLAASTIRVVVRAGHAPMATPLLLAGGVMLLASQMLHVWGALDRWDGGLEGGGLEWLGAAQRFTQWSGVGLLLFGFYLSLVEAATANLSLQREQARLRREIEHHRETTSQLMEIRGELELRVRRRTDELSSAVTRLEQEIEQHFHTETALRESEERFRQIAASTGDWIWAVDEFGRFSYCSQGVAKCLGHDPAQVIDRPFADFLPVQPKPEEGVEDFFRLIEGRAKFFRVETRFLHRDGRLLSHETTGIPQFNADGRWIGCRGVNRDITEEKLLEEQLHQMRRMDALGQLVGGVAHDFNNLITVMMGCCDSLRSLVAEDDEALHVVSVLQDTAEQATNTARSLLMLGSQKSGPRKRVDLRAMLRQSGRLLSRLMPAGVRLEVDADGPPLWIESNGQMQQVVLNLAVNARDAMPSGGVLTLQAREALDQDQQPTAQLLAHDTGQGIEPENVVKIFEPFFTTKPRGKGTGLGLSIVKSIVADHGGRISVASRMGQGTTFTVELPQMDPPSGETSAPSSTVDSRGRGELIMLAEDNVLVRALITSKLRALGYDVAAVGDGAEFLKLLASQADRVRLAVLDIDLPSVSGWECLKAVRRAGPMTPVILITAQAVADDDPRLDESTLLLPKPFEVAQLGALAGLTLRSFEPDEVDSSVHR